MQHIFIGGAARCGKSTVTRSVRCTLGGEVYALSGDALRNTLRRTVARGIFPILQGPRPEKIPDEADFIAYHSKQAAVEVEAKREQARFMWPFIQAYAREVEHESGGSIIAESIDIWPDLLATSGLSHRAAFLVDTSEGQADRIIATRYSDPYDWMHQNDYSDGRIRAWCQFNALRSQTIIELAATTGYLCVDLAKTPFNQAQQTVHEYLTA